MSNAILLEKIKNLPDSPGVYSFLDKDKKVLYIGKATSLRDRVKSYFNDDVIKTRGRRIVDMISLSCDIDYTATASVLEALILESKLIKEFAPKYNSKDKDNKSFNYVIVTKEKYPIVKVIRERNLEKTLSKKDIKYSWGPFTSGSSLQIALKIIRKIFPFRDEKCVLGKNKPCFNYQIGLCPGTCIGAINEREYKETIKHIKLFFDGKKKELIKNLEKDMNLAVKELNFEKAQKIKKTIFSLDHIQDISLIRKEDDFYSDNDNDIRIESYDIAHLSGQNTVGVMVALENGLLKKTDYRKFKIKGSDAEINDPKNLEEVLDRRFSHTEWTTPNIVVVDGNEIQMNVAKKVLQKNNIKDVEIVAVTKDSRHKPQYLSGNKEIINNYTDQILLANSEAHRFAIAYHRHLRKKNFAR